MTAGMCLTQGLHRSSGAAGRGEVGENVCSVEVENALARSVG
ncbi:hypothetical protein [Mycolicibacterium sarraceniae]|nr:hypothetical protein [Mycolicibacterium sarraceniae]